MLIKPHFVVAVALFANILGACSSATDPIALSPESTEGISGVSLSVDSAINPEDAVDSRAFADASRVTIVGVIEELPPANQLIGRVIGFWVVGGQNVQVVSQTELLSSTFTLGEFVRVIGRQVTPNVIVATSIEAVAADFVGGAGDNILVGSDNVDVIDAGAGDDTIDGRGGADEITTGSGNDVLVYDASSSDIDQISDFDIQSDQFLFDASDFDIQGDLSFINALAADLPPGGVNVIVLQDADDDNDPATVFNARSSARLIADQVTEAVPGSFVYFNSSLSLNRLVYTPDLSDGEAPLTILNALTNLTGQDAIDALPTFTASNFAFEDETVIFGDDVDNTLIGTAADDVLFGERGNDTIDGQAGSDQIATNLGNDIVVYNATQLGSDADQLSDWNVNRDQFLLNAADFGVIGGVSFINAEAVDLPAAGVNVIVLQDTDDDNDPATVFNARSAARLIGAQVEEAGPGFFIYWNSSLGVNRLVFTPDLSDGEAAFTVLSAINTVTGQDAIDQLPVFTAANFLFN